jgi:hypothetical protein
MRTGRMRDHLAAIACAWEKAEAHPFNRGLSVRFRCSLSRCSGWKGLGLDIIHSPSPLKDDEKAHRWGCFVLAIFSKRLYGCFIFLHPTL